MEKTRSYHVIKRRGEEDSRWLFSLMNLEDSLPRIVAEGSSPARLAEDIDSRGQSMASYQERSLSFTFATPCFLHICADGTRSFFAPLTTAEQRAFETKLHASVWGNKETIL